jgi:hypothetical protein
MPKWFWTAKQVDSDMNRRELFLLLLLALSLPAASQTVSRDEQTVLSLSKRKFDWLISKQYDSLTALMDDRIQYIHSNGWTQNKKEVLEDLRSGKLNYQKVTIKESGARIFGTSAVVTGLGTFEGITEGKLFTMDLRYTEVYIKSGNRWKLASRHANKMP